MAMMTGNYPKGYATGPTDKIGMLANRYWEKMNDFSTVGACMRQIKAFASEVKCERNWLGHHLVKANDIVGKAVPALKRAKVDAEAIEGVRIARSLIAFIELEVKTQELYVETKRIKETKPEYDLSAINNLIHRNRFVDIVNTHFSDIVNYTDATENTLKTIKQV